MKKIVKNKWFKYCLVLIWMLVIFKFSSDIASVSDEKSGLVIKLFNYVGIDLNTSLGNWANFAVRKSAHFIEYFILCLLITNALTEDFNLYNTIFLSILITFLYAVSDEVHQLFVPGRAGRIRDVIIDTSGGACYLIIKLILNILRR